MRTRKTYNGKETQLRKLSDRSVTLGAIAMERSKRLEAENSRRMIMENTGKMILKKSNLRRTAGQVWRKVMEVEDVPLGWGVP